LVTTLFRILCIEGLEQVLTSNLYLGLFLDLVAVVGKTLFGGHGGSRLIDVKGREVDAAIVNTRDGWTKFGRETARWKGFGDQTRSGMRAVVLELWRQEGLVLGVAGHRMRRRPGHGRHLSRPRLSSHGCLSRAGDGSGSGSYEVQRAHRLRPEKPDLSKKCGDGDAIRILCINHLLIFSTSHDCDAAVGSHRLRAGRSHLFTSAFADRLELSSTSNPVTLRGRTRPEQVISSIAHVYIYLRAPMILYLL
ncbi:hypothetical protein KCU81_g389, partial [Aureobasidium melanogenum]